MTTIFKPRWKCVYVGATMKCLCRNAHWNCPLLCFPRKETGKLFVDSKRHAKQSDITVGDEVLLKQKHQNKPNTNNVWANAVPTKLWKNLETRLWSSRQTRVVWWNATSRILDRMCVMIRTWRHQQRQPTTPWSRHQHRRLQRPPFDVPRDIVDS